MPTRATKPKMEDRVEKLEVTVGALEETVGGMNETMNLLMLQMQQQSKMMAEVTKKLGIPQPTSSREDSVEEVPLPPPARAESVEASSQNESRLAGKKVKLPVFEGDDPVAWITRAKIYFDVQNTPDALRVKLSRLSVDGPTIHWFNLLLETEDDLSWEKLKKSLIARYGGRRLENPFEELSTLRQTGSVEEFVEAKARATSSINF
ncbi:pentatricopeptide repeat-containing protein [Trifolium pratense]|uniref:Pentatricopeptide repeat-containing protein n=1 Tax=Trifolium pratense TaxID=57577 RepID=A0A2K3LJ80_TRIPR|nr:pentatricopeptide repeat-containing protein [Trifolium pratense]PNX86921.1 pentatricopeptide repeat-containing protein [Trifolium pratense]